MTARFRDIKAGALDGEGAINNVEAALNRVTLASGEQMSIMNRQTGEFKDFTVVIEQLASRWNTLGDIEQENIIKAVAGIRQRNTFIALMENQEMVTTLLAEAENSAGLAADRYAIYLDGLEAAQNRAQASSELLWAATIESDAIVWFYDMTAALFDFITAIGGLDGLIVPIIAGFGAWAVASGTLGTALTALSASIAQVGVASALSGGLVTIIAMAVATIAGSIAIATTKMKEFNEEASGNWVQSLDELGKKTDGTRAILRKFIEDVEYLNSLSFGENLVVDQEKLIEEGLKKTIEILGESANSWEDYSSSIEKAAKIAGYSIDEQGNLYKVVRSGGVDFKRTADDIDLLNESMFIARDMTDSWAGRLEYLKDQMGASDDEIQHLDSVVSEFTETFQVFINQANELAVGDNGISAITEDFTLLNKMFREGTLDADAYFEQMKTQLDTLDLTESFGDNQEAASMFFSGLVLNAADSISHINALWESGETNLTEYTESLIGVGNMFTEIGEMAEFMGVDTAVTDAIANITSGVESLSQAQEANITIQDALYKVTEEGLKFGTETFNLQMKQVADAMAASGIMYTTTSGRALKSTQDILGFLTAADGNFQILTEQSGNATGRMIQTVVNGAGQMITGLADMIKNFNATIYFTPSISGGGGSILDMLMGKAPLPTVTFDVGANVTSVSTPSLPLSAITGGGYESTVGKEGRGGIFETLGAFGESLQAWEPGDIDYGKPAGQMKALEDTVGSLAHAYKNLEKSSKSAADAQKEEEKAREKALKSQLDAYKDIIDARKKLLKTMEEEEDYQRKLSGMQGDLSRVQSEIEELRLDDSEEANARRRALEEDAAEIALDIEEEQLDRSFDLQEDALDAEYDRFKRYIEGQIDGGGYAGNFSPMAMGGMDVATMAAPNIEMGGGYGGAFSIENLIELNVSGNLDSSVLPDIEKIAELATAKIYEMFQNRGWTRNANQFQT